MGHSFKGNENIGLDIACGLATCTAAYSLAEGVYMQVATGIANTYFFHSTLYLGPTLISVLLLTLGLSILWTRGRTAILASVVGCGIGLVSQQRFPGSFPWPGTETNLYDKGLSFYPAIVIALPLSLVAKKLAGPKRASDISVASVTAIVYVAALTLAIVHSSTKPLMEDDYPFSRHTALLIVGAASLLAFPFVWIETRIFGDLGDNG